MKKSEAFFALDELWQNATEKQREALKIAQEAIEAIDLKEYIKPTSPDGNTAFEHSYQSFKLRWMLDHGYTLSDLMRELQEFQYSDPEDSDRISTPVTELFEEWEQDRGFGGEIWPCEAEYEECGC